MMADGTFAHSGQGPTPSSGSILHSGYWLVLSLLAISYALCAAQTSPDPSAAVLFIQLVTVAVTLWVAEVNPRLRRMGWIIVLGAAVVVAVVAIIGTTGRVLDIVLSAASIVAYLIAPFAIITHERKKKRIDGQVLLAAIAAYIMVGMFFTFVYNFIALTTSMPTFGDGHVDSLTSQLFFSFTTLTTTGYGDKVPVTAGVQSIAIAEAITGQLFLVIAVARVVSGWKRATSA